MSRIAYLVNIFPTPVEPYVIDEIRELEKRGVTVIPCSVRRPRNQLTPELQAWTRRTFYLEPLCLRTMLRAAWVCTRRFNLVKKFIFRALIRPTVTERRLRALAHTLLGVYFALSMQEQRVTHIHVHHGYFGSWVAMVAAEILNIPFSITLHGSDLLMHAAYLDIKLRQCQFCATVSEFNRRHIVTNYPDVNAQKIYVRRLGVECGSQTPMRSAGAENSPLRMLAVGRLHPVKDHAFLVRACALLKERGMQIACSIVGDGPERPLLEKLIRDLKLEYEVRLLGEIPHEEMPARYENADLVVLTSRSEGIPLALMEAMAREKIVLAPAITGVPELVLDGKTGFLYRPGSLENFVAQVQLIGSLGPRVTEIRINARQRVLQQFNREKNVAAFCELLTTNRTVPQISIPA